MSAYQELEQLCGTIKHASDPHATYTWADIRAIARRAQYELETVSEMINPDEVHLVDGKLTCVWNEPTITMMERLVSGRISEAEVQE